MSLPSPPNSIRGDLHDGNQVLAAVQEQLLGSLLPALEQALRESAEGQFEQGRVVERVRHALIAGFRELPAGKPAASVVAPGLNLSLLSEDALETQLARDQVVDGMSRANARSLDMLARRLARSSGRDELQASENPLAPAFIVQALEAALQEADSDAGRRIAALRSVERPLADALARAYERCEAMLASGQLPQKARPATSATPSVAIRTEKLSRFVDLSKCPVERYGRSVSIPPKAQNESNDPPREASPGMMWRSPSTKVPITASH